jgi:hypothetical protein
LKEYGRAMTKVKGLDAMTTSLKLTGAAAAACAACCAISIAPALIAGPSLVAIGSAASTWGVGFIALAIPVVGLYFLSRRKAAPNADFRTLIAAESCGCGPSCASTAQEEEPIACTLGAADFKERVAGIRALARRSLRQASRSPLSLRLTYEPNALEEVRDLMRKEQTCCAFLTFDLKNNATGVLLTITAPKSAAEAADALFDHFAPELAASSLKETA